jgi:hypothetical protein
MLKAPFIGLLFATCLFAHGAEAPRFVRLDHRGQPLAAGQQGPWPCVWDRDTGLAWEVKSSDTGLHARDNVYQWYAPDAATNGGFAGHPGGPACRSRPCDTQALVQAVNRLGWCGARDWRLPTREELRSLVDYRIPYPGPTIDGDFFPNALAQFYWSADPSADNPHEAWGMGFAHGFDYAYDKSNRVYVRLVRKYRP